MWGGENGSVGAEADHHIDGGMPRPQGGTFIPFVPMRRLSERVCAPYWFVCFFISQTTQFPCLLSNIYVYVLCCGVSPVSLFT